LENNLRSRIPFLAGICTAHPWSSTGKSIDEQHNGLQMAERIQTFTILTSNNSLGKYNEYLPSL
jgi:hypothetical protein